MHSSRKSIFPISMIIEPTLPFMEHPSLNTLTSHHGLCIMTRDTLTLFWSGYSTGQNVHIYIYMQRSKWDIISKIHCWPSAYLILSPWPSVACPASAAWPLPNIWNQNLDGLNHYALKCVPLDLTSFIQLPQFCIMQHIWYSYYVNTPPSEAISILSLPSISW